MPISPLDEQEGGQIAPQTLLAFHNSQICSPGQFSSFRKIEKEHKYPIIVHNFNRQKNYNFDSEGLVVVL